MLQFVSTIYKMSGRSCIGCTTSKMPIMLARDINKKYQLPNVGGYQSLD